MSFPRKPLLACLSALAAALPVLRADDAAAAATPKEAKRVYHITRLSTPPPSIDGKLNDPCWSAGGEWAADYIQREPHERARASHPTEIKVLYDNRYLYVAIRAHQPGVGDKKPRMGGRDEFTGDMVGISLDSYHNLSSAFEFDVTSGGSKIDLILKNDGSADTSWNAVWDVKTSVEKDLWTAEFRIPLSQLRYAPGKNQTWGMHSWRWIQSLQEESNWKLLPMDNQGLVYSFGELQDIKDIPPSRRLELVPYAIGKLSTHKREEGNPFNNGRKTASDFGLDVKYGISSDITIDVTLNPDFAQVEADPSEINLSTVETFLKERRPFFLEGKDIFEVKFDDDLAFYSRRIGDAPALTPRTAGFADRPESTRILGSAKITGRTKEGLTLGLLHATTDRMESRVLTTSGIHSELAEPLTNADVVRLQQDFNGGDTTIGTLFTSNIRTGGEDELQQLTRKAFSAGVDATHYWGNRTYLAEAKIMATEVRGSTAAITNLMENPVHNYQRPDADHVEVDTTSHSLAGNAGLLKIGRANNGKWRYNGFTTWRSPGVEFNDLGYLQSADQFTAGANLQFYSTETGTLLRRKDIRLHPSQTWDYSGQLLGRDLYLNSELATMSGAFLWSRLGTSIDNLDTRVLRGGPALREPNFYYGNLYAEGPGSMPVQPKLDGGYSFSAEPGAAYFRFGPGLVSRLNGRFKTELTVSYERNLQPSQFANVSEAGGQTNYIMGHLRQQTLSTTLRLDMNFTPAISLSYYGGPFASTGRYDSFKRVIAPRASLEDRFTPVDVKLTGSTYIGKSDATPLRFSNPDFDWRELKSNLVLRWEYKAGSTLYCVWSQYRSDWQNAGGFSPATQYKTLFEAHPDNSFLIKLSYWFSI